MSNELRIVQLREVCSQIRGVSYNPSDLATELTTQCVTLLRANNIQDRIIFDDVQYVNRSKVSEKQYIKKGDILICASSGSKNLVGKAVQANENYDACFGAFCKVVRPKNIDIRYLGCYFKSDTYRSEISRKSRGANINNIKNEDIDSLVIPLPSLERQREIAAVLDKASELIEKRKEQLRELDTLAESVFYDMFGDPVTNTKGWNVSSLKRLTTKIGSGATPKGGNENYKNEGVSLIRSLNVHNAKFKYKDLAFIDEMQARALDGVTVEQNDVLLNITGASVARCCIVPNKILPARVNQHVAILRCKRDRLNYRFLCSVLISNEFQNKLLKDSKSNGATREALTKSNLENLIIIIPAIELQKQFATIIEKIEEQKAKVKEAIKESEDLFQRLMQDMFTPIDPKK